MWWICIHFMYFKTRKHLILVKNLVNKNMSQHNKVRLFSVKLIFKLDRQKYEPRLNFVILDIFFLNIITRTSIKTNACFNKNVEEKRCYGTFASWLARRSTCKLKSLGAQIFISCVGRYHTWQCSTVHIDRNIIQ